MAFQSARKSNCMAVIVNGEKYPLPTGDVNEIPMEIRRAFAKELCEADARLAEEGRERLAFTP